MSRELNGYAEDEFGAKAHQLTDIYVKVDQMRHSGVAGWEAVMRRFVRVAAYSIKKQAAAAKEDPAMLRELTTSQIVEMYTMMLGASGSRHPSPELMPVAQQVEQLLNFGIDERLRQFAALRARAPRNPDVLREAETLQMETQSDLIRLRGLGFNARPVDLAAEVHQVQLAHLAQWLNPPPKR
jgi:hypothetical protein